MPQRKSSVEELRKNYKRHAHNLDIKTDLKKTTKKFLTTVNEKNKQSAKDMLSIMYKKLDKAAKRKVIDKKTASRRKSKFSRLLAGIA